MALPRVVATAQHPGLTEQPDTGHCLRYVVDQEQIAWLGTRVKDLTEQLTERDEEMLAAAIRTTNEIASRTKASAQNHA